MKMITFLHLLAFIVSLIVFGMSIWQHNINWFALTTSMYILSAMALSALD